MPTCLNPALLLLHVPLVPRSIFSGAAWSGPTVEDDGAVVLSASRQLRSEDGQVLGVVGAHLDLLRLDEVLADAAQSNRQVAH